MVANAGIAQVKALLDLTEQDLKRMFEVNGKHHAFNIQVLANITQYTAYTTATPQPPNK
jgi:NAD(P)-dependent dehydrogenase (short-subunit alcohol dehydrogenase family)